jgi:putative nucleotidyltransferase with HDIG domain
MWPFGKRSARRQEIRRSKVERGLTWYARLGGRLPLLPSAIATACALLSALVVNLGGDVLTIRVGQVLPRAITSRVDFSVENKKRTSENRGVARDNADIYYELDGSLLRDIRGRLTSALKLAQDSADAPDELPKEALKAKIVLNDEGRTELLRIATLKDTEALKRVTAQFEQSVADAVTRLAQSSTPLVEMVDSSQRRTPIRAVLIDRQERAAGAGAQQRTVPVASLLYSNRPDAAETVAEAAAKAFSGPLRTSMQDTLLEMLRGEVEGSSKPIYRYLPEESERAAQDAYDRVPTEYDVYARGRKLVDAGEVTRDGFELLQQEHDAFRKWLSSGGKPLTDAEQTKLRRDDATAYERWLEDGAAARAAQTARWHAAWAYVFLAALITIGLVYHASQARRVFRPDLPRQLLAAVVLLGLLGLARLVFVTTSAAHYAVGAQAFAAALLAIIFARGPVLAFCGSQALLMTLATRQGVGFLLVLAALSMVLRLGLYDVRSRGKIVAIGSGAAAVVLITTIAAGLIDQQGFAFVFWQQALPAAGTTLVAAFLIEGLLPLIERLFRVATNMTLLEWCDASRPLQRMLAAEAPGTYNHSLLVGTLAEAAADAIGANGLLARTGAYYHDIGKISKPAYFAENKSLGESRHGRLSPAMSHLIIIGHVKDGIEMAREYGVPAALHPFIPEHHGTMLVQYFYHAASLQRKPGEREVSDVEFRYPGPKPQSRETAVLMISDGVESAVRAMPEPTPARIEDVVAKISRQRMTDGQFDECDLTFRELQIIERSLIKSLCAIYHSRIEYPEHEEDERAPESRAS